MGESSYFDLYNTMIKYGSPPFKIVEKVPRGGGFALTLALNQTGFLQNHKRVHRLLISIIIVD